MTGRRTLPTMAAGICRRKHQTRYSRHIAVVVTPADTLLYLEFVRVSTKAEGVNILRKKSASVRRADGAMASHSALPTKAADIVDNINRIDILLSSSSCLVGGFAFWWCLFKGRDPKI